MAVFIYNKNGLIEERPESDWATAGAEIYEHNLANPELPRKLLVSPLFPPLDYVFDIEIGDIRPKRVAEKLAEGAIELAPGDRIVSGPFGEVVVPIGYRLNERGELRPKSIEEQISEGIRSFDSEKQKIVNGAIVPKSRQELLDEGVITVADVLAYSLNRLRGSVEAYLSTNATNNGYRMDNLARQKAALSMQFRQLPDTDPVKADLLQRKVIYTDAIVDEILNEIERVQGAYDQAKNALQSIANQNQPVSVFDSVIIEDYLSAS